MNVVRQKLKKAKNGREGRKWKFVAEDEVKKTTTLSIQQLQVSWFEALDEGDTYLDVLTEPPLTTRRTNYNSFPP